MKPILVIPVFRGGEYFRDCLNSIVGKEEYFEQIFISFNGTKTDVEADFIVFKESKLNKKNIKTIKSQKYLSSTKHSFFILEELKKNGCSDTTLIMNLFHDDKLLNPPELTEILNSEIIFGDWKILGSEKFESAINFPFEDPKSWLQRFGFYKIFTNGSGMVSTLKIFQDVNSFMMNYDSGVRYEYLLVTHRQIARIKSVDRPLVEIRIHSDQGGKNISLNNFVKGEIGFIKWLFSQGRVQSFKEYLIVLFLFASIISGMIRRAFGYFTFNKLK